MTGSSISRMLRTKAEALLIEINGGYDSADVVRGKVTQSLGPETKVHKLEDKFSKEKRDLDGEITKEEVLNALTDLADLYMCTG